MSERFGNSDTACVDFNLYIGLEGICIHTYNAHTWENLSEFEGGPACSLVHI